MWKLNTTQLINYQATVAENVDVGAANGANIGMRNPRSPPSTSLREPTHLALLIIHHATRHLHLLLLLHPMAMVITVIRAAHNMTMKRSFSVTIMMMMIVAFFQMIMIHWGIVILQMMMIHVRNVFRFLVVKLCGCFQSSAEIQAGHSGQGGHFLPSWAGLCNWIQRGRVCPF